MATDPHERVRSLHCSSRQGKRPAPELRQSPAAGTVQALTQHWPHWLYTTFETDVASAPVRFGPDAPPASSWVLLLEASSSLIQLDAVGLARLPPTSHPASRISLHASNGARIDPRSPDIRREKIPLAAVQLQRPCAGHRAPPAILNAKRSTPIHPAYS
ncbi:uncharacterized protein PAN0_010c4039 [Moesziomyces antarcticus]|uniref:Uncharacterized protein n=1 Tax=Pseudozyma antarctica TaxID=84753 RepID=A0A081CGM2_PSEA2|nr:uncharacterized protein PAN0_010c4039 [Moesziomyces antarcticus]GAK65818.1 hypothetical protein PAN0_010c4039 [Moesziomyces antarcticus]